MTDDDSAELLVRFQRGEAGVADELFNRYVRRLVALARHRIAPSLGRRIEPDDVVQSAYRSFFTKARDGEVRLAGKGDLWRLLAAITVNKVRHQVERHTAAKRDFSAEVSFSSDNSVQIRPEAVAREPGPDEATALAEEVQLLMRGFDGVQRQMLEMRLQGFLIEEIAEEVQRSERSVRRLLDKVKLHLATRMPHEVQLPTE